jgi:hypothetical protein
VSLLDLLVGYVPALAEDRWTRMPYRLDPSVLGKPGQSDSRAWLSQAICEIQPQLAPVFRGLIETLVRHGLVLERDRTTEAFRKFANSQAAFQRRLVNRRERGQPDLPDSPGIPDAPPHWSPTPFGEQVLGYYREAGSEEQDVASDGSQPK